MLNYQDLMGAIESEFFLAKLKREIAHIDDPEALRGIILEVVRLMQNQRQVFTDLSNGLIDLESQDF